MLHLVLEYRVRPAAHEGGESIVGVNCSYRYVFYRNIIPRPINVERIHDIVAGYGNTTRFEIHGVTVHRPTGPGNISERARDGDRHVYGARSHVHHCRALPVKDELAVADAGEFRARS